MNILKINGTDRPDQWFKGNETDRSGCFAQMRESIDHIRIFDAGAEPDIGKDIPDLSCDQLSHAFRSLREDLVIVVGRLAHDLPDIQNEGVTDSFMK